MKFRPKSSLEVVSPENRRGKVKWIGLQRDRGRVKDRLSREGTKKRSDVRQ